VVLKNRDFIKLDGAVYVGFEKLPKTRYYNKLLIDGTLALVSYFLDKNQHYKSLQLLEKARQSFPKNRKIVSNEINLLESIFNLNYGAFVERDFILVETIANLLLHTYKSGFPGVRSVLEKLIDTIKILSENAIKEAESKNTFYLERFLLNLYGDLTKEQQIEEFSKIIMPELLKWLAEESDKDPKDDNKSESDNQED